MTKKTVITDEEVQCFHDNGYLIVRQALGQEELAQLQAATAELVEYGSETVRDNRDYAYGTGHRTGKPVLKRIEYVIDKKEACKALLGNPFILCSVERLMGNDFFPTWDSMVLKMPGEGIIVPWHRDAGTQFVGDQPIFNVDFYLDEATLENCLWVYPGSHLWDETRVQAITTQDGFPTEGATPVPMQPGDVLFHNILLVHGSPASNVDRLRRVLYYEFRTAHVESAMGPHTPDYIPLKQRVLMKCLEHRESTNYAQGEDPFIYHPPAPFQIDWTPGSTIPTYRYPHEEFWRG